MAKPTYSATPRKETNSKDERPERIWGLLLLLGGIGALIISATHPQGSPVTHAGETAAWTTIHVFGALAFGLIAIAALLQLTRGRAPNRTGAVALAGVTVFGTVAMIAMTIDGFLNPALAAIQGEPGAAAVTTAFLALERGAAAFGYGGFGLAAALMVSSHLPAMGTPMRIAGGLAVVALVAFAGAGILYIGFDIAALGPLFAGGLLWSAWFVLWGARLTFGRAAATPVRMGTPTRSV